MVRVVLNIHAEGTRMFPKIGNYLWAGVCGWWVYLVYMIVGGFLLLTPAGRPYGHLAIKLAKYYLWPFSKCMISHGSQNMAEREALFHHRETKARPYDKLPVTCGFGCSLWTLCSCEKLSLFNQIQFFGFGDTHSAIMSGKIIF
jgi:hypothetical protein